MPGSNKDQHDILTLLNTDERRLWDMCRKRRKINSDAPSQHKYDRAGNRVYWKLTPFEVRMLLEQAGISVWDWGQGKGKYNLARIDDLGNYEMGNCRFLPQEDNIREMNLHRKSNSEALRSTGPSSCIQCGRYCKSLMSLIAHYSRSKTH